MQSSYKIKNYFFEKTETKAVTSIQLKNAFKKKANDYRSKQKVTLMGKTFYLFSLINNSILLFDCYKNKMNYLITIIIIIVVRLLLWLLQ